MDNVWRLLPAMSTPTSGRGKFGIGNKNWHNYSDNVRSLIFAEKHNKYIALHLALTSTKHVTDFRILFIMSFNVYFIMKDLFYIFL
jgi:hypothetical protein